MPANYIKKAVTVFIAGIVVHPRPVPTNMDSS